MLQSLVGQEVLVRLKWGKQTEYTGKLVSIDSYMNLQLSGTEEFMEGAGTGGLGQVLIRYVRDTKCGGSWGNGLVGKEGRRVIGRSRGEEAR